jgi:hypothetical protein
MKHVESWGIWVFLLVAAAALSAAPGFALQAPDQTFGGFGGGFGGGSGGGFGGGPGGGMMGGGGGMMGGGGGMMGGGGGMMGGGGGMMGGGGGMMGGGPGGGMMGGRDSRMPQPDAPPLSIQNQQQKPMVLKMRVDNSLISLEIADCPMQYALREMADRTGIIFKVRNQDNQLVSAQAQKISFEDAIKLITPGRSVVYDYGDTNNPQHLTGASIFSRVTTAGAVQQPEFVYLGNGRITKVNDDFSMFQQASMVLSGNALPDVKKSAIGYLVQNKSAESVKILTGALSDPTPEIRIAVIDGLARLDAHDALPTILKSLKNENSGVRQSALKAVLQLGDATNVKDIEHLKTDKDPMVAASAESTIRKLSAPAGKQ